MDKYEGHFEDVDFARLLRVERKKRCLSLVEVAEVVMVSPSYIYLLEEGRRKTPGYNVGSRIINYFRLTSYELGDYKRSTNSD